MRSTGTKLLFAGVAIASLLAACGSDSESGSGGGEAITLAVNPWIGSAVNAYVAQAVI